VCHMHMDLQHSTCKESRELGTYTDCGSCSLPPLHTPSASLLIITLCPALSCADWYPPTHTQAKAGKMKYIIGDGSNVWDFTYVGNVAQAHVLVSQ
jgi:hypothetical protein